MLLDRHGFLGFNDTLSSPKSGDKIKNVQKKACLAWMYFVTWHLLLRLPKLLWFYPLSLHHTWVAKAVVPPVVLGTLAQYFYTNYVNVEIFCKKTSIIAIGSCFAAGVNYLLNAFFIPRFSYTAAAYTTFASYAILMIMHYIMVLRKNQCPS